MNSNSNIDYANQCSIFEKEIRDGLNNIKETSGIDRFNLIQELLSKISTAQRYLAMIQIEASEISDSGMQEEYNDQYEKHNDEISKLEEQVRNAEKTAHAQEKANFDSSNIHNVMDKAQQFQEQQKDSLDRSVILQNNIQNVGNEIIVEIDRQKHVLEQTQNCLEDMDSELTRAKKYMNIILNRMKNDYCIIVGIILVILVLMVIIVIECIHPKATAKHNNGWFSSKTESYNATKYK